MPVISSACSVILVQLLSERVCGFPNLGVPARVCSIWNRSMIHFIVLVWGYIMKLLFVQLEGGLVRIWTKKLFNYKVPLLEGIAFLVRVRQFFLNFKTDRNLGCFMFLLWPTLLLVFYGLPYCFSTVLRATSASMHTVPLCLRHNYFRILSFLKLFTSTQNEVGHETCSSSWSYARNFIWNVCSQF